MSKKKEEGDRDSSQTLSVQLFSDSVTGAVQKFRNSCQAAQHTGRLIAFSELLREVFGVNIDDIVPKIEQYKSDKINALRGRPDLPFGDVIIEMKTNIQGERKKAIEELSRYGPLLMAKQDDPIPIGLVTDGFLFEVYTYELKDGKPKIDDEGRFIVEEEPIESFNLDSLTPEGFCLRLDSLLFQTHPRPTSADLALRFGAGSPTFYAVMAALESAYASCKEDIGTRLEEWEKNMTIVYGNSPGIEAFLGHTYLVLLSRFLLDLKINGPIRNKDDLISSIRGERLAQLGLGGREGGYFDWVLEPAASKYALPKLKILTDQLSLYDFKSVTGDLFRAIYQEIVTREVRHQTGEYYTPQWLAEMVVGRVIGKKGIPSILDPACGSGTFLAAAIEALRERGAHLQDILSKVVGIDMNPMAVEIAKATYLLGLGQLIKERVHEIEIPIYVADSLRLPHPKTTIEESMPIYEFDIHGQRLVLPKALIQNEKVLLRTLQIVSSILEQYEAKSLRQDDAKEAMKNRFLDTFKDRAKRVEESDILCETLTVLMGLIDAKRDSIWIFILKNLYAPARLSEEKFDIVIGNPPWIALRYIADDQYQNFLKSRMKEMGLLNPKLPQLVTQTEIATLFFAEASRLYLKEKGTIAFVMPRSIITGAKQHQSFQRLSTPRFIELIDLEGVKPLFNVPSCVLVATKKGKTKLPIPTMKISGLLSERDAPYSIIKAQLIVENTSWKPASSLKGETNTSPYINHFKQGATLVPRNCWFVEFVIKSETGLNPDAPFVRTSRESISKAKKPWDKVEMEGAIEGGFIFATLLGNDIFSFCHQQLRPVVLPVSISSSGKNKMLDADLARSGKPLMSKWLSKCQSYWEELATKTSKTNFPRIVDRLNRGAGLTNQNSERYAILFPASGTHVAACMLDTRPLPSFRINGQEIKPVDFLADAKTYVYRTDSEEEGIYLVGILNSRIINEEIKKTQSQGSFGPRDIHKRPLEIPFPGYDPKNQEHKRIVDLTRQAIIQATAFMNSGRKGRKKFRNELEGIEELDKLVVNLIS